MTSTRPSETAGSRGLGDIRQQYKEDTGLQDYTLRHHHPVDFSPNKAREGVAGWAGKSFGDAEIQALDVVIIVLRHLFSFIPHEDRQEDENPFARMIWAELGASRTRDAQTHERARILLRFASDPLTEKFAIDAHNLLENEAMWSTVWVMPAFRLWDAKVLGCRIGGNRWQEVETPPDTELSRYSQVPYFGDVDLDGRISDEFGMRVEEDEGVEAYWQGGPHMVLRVLYDATEKDSQSKGFGELRELHVNPYRYEPSGREGERPWYNPDDLSRYTLAAVVRMGKSGVAGSKDLVRLYDGLGYYQPLPFTMQARLTTDGKGVEEEWRLGELGWKYMLFYIRGPREAPPLLIDPVELYDCSKRVAHLKMMKAILQPRDDDEDENMHEVEASTSSEFPRPPLAALRSMQESKNEASGSSGFLRPPPTAPRSMREAAERASSAREHRG